MLHHPEVDIEFSPPNTTSLLQLMDQTIIATFKSYYLSQVIKNMLHTENKHRTCKNFASENIVWDFLKWPLFLDCLRYIEESWKECSKTTLNKSWSKLLPKFFKDPWKPIFSYKQTVQGKWNLKLQNFLQNKHFFFLKSAFLTLREPYFQKLWVSVYAAHFWNGSPAYNEGWLYSNNFF